MKKEMIQVSVSELESCIHDLSTLQSISQNASSSRMHRPSHAGQAQAVAVLESVADTCEQIEAAYDALLSATIQFLNGAKTAIMNADEQAERLIR